ncbi:HNH endonuclease [Robbsia andropogonis]|uniref:HNH endonuclease n=1 Tax=Robbsia andropogonis TaxID=28092 RepID=UPI00209DCB0A|nr:HNH endonuclease [Robbsia andropogonis]MCP1120097.1 NUMOD4 motif-containing HNH endonuclease [Robbsia andropogonis]MCP1130071.1 NUMOD4 motif-containing HNH endonuclease [Robbsia andropogonis]
MRNLPSESGVSDERWVAIEAYPDYAVSDHGRIKRLTSRTCAKAGAILKTPPRSKARQYPSVDLCRIGQKKRTELVHILVAKAFLDPAPFEGAEVNHIDGNKANPYFKNLEWITSSGNKVHAYESGLSDAKGEANGQSKLTDSAVLEIRMLAAKGAASAKFLAVRFGVNERTIQDVVRRVSWAHI